jgi:hypothetical protein
MRQFPGYLLLSSALLLGVGCSDPRRGKNKSDSHSIQQDVYPYKPLVQENSIKHHLSPTQIPLKLYAISAIAYQFTLGKQFKFLTFNKQNLLTMISMIYNRQFNYQI